MQARTRVFQYLSSSCPKQFVVCSQCNQDALVKSGNNTQSNSLARGWDWVVCVNRGSLASVPGPCPVYPAKKQGRCSVGSLLPWSGTTSSTCLPPFQRWPLHSRASSSSELRVSDTIRYMPNGLQLQYLLCMEMALASQTPS